MKWLLARIGLPKAIGLFVDEEAITLSQIVSTPFGPVEIARQVETMAGEDRGQVITKLLGPFFGKRKLRRLPVSVGVPLRRVYYSTRPVHAATGDSSPHVLLREAMQSQNVPVHEMAVDVIKSDPDGREVASIAACDKAYLNEILDALTQLGIHPHRTEPAPCALLRLAAARHRVKRGEKVVLRLFLSDRQALTVLVVDNAPLLWRTTQLPHGEEAAALVTSCRSLLVTSKDCGVESPLDAVVFHGRAELRRLVDVDWIEEQIEASVAWADGPTLDAGQITMGLALGGFDRSDSGSDLARSLKPRPSLMRLFPWRDAVLEGALVACMGLFLGYRYWTLQEAHQSLEIRAAASQADVRASERELLKEKKAMEEQVQAIHEFLATRVTWTSCLRELAPRVPKEVYLTSIRGQRPLKNLSKTRSAKSKDTLVLRGEVMVKTGGRVPQEIDRFLVALRSLPTLEKYFPQITVDELKQSAARRGIAPRARFAVVCLPGEKKASKAAGPAAKSAGKGAKRKS